MKIELEKSLNQKDIATKIKDAEIVDANGDYYLLEKKRRISVNGIHSSCIIDAHDILYTEIIDRTHYVYCYDQTYTVNQSLNDLEKDPLMRINRSTLININHISDIKVKLNMRFAVQINGTWLYVNRTYHTAFKERMGI